jgi:Malic enzyme, NAD binding domain
MTSNTQGVEFLRNPSVNKATAYSETEKQSLGLVGLVPDVTETIDTQLSRVLWQLQQKTRVTDEMFIEAAHAVADQVRPDQLKLGMLFPPQSNILETEIQTAARVAKLVFDSGLARVERPADMVAFIREHVYKPEYSVGAIGASKAA